MRTRTLLLLAVACGVAILGAGAALFLQLAGRDDPARPVEVEAEVTVGDLRVEVESFVEEAGRFAVVVDLGGVDDGDAIDGFRLVTPDGAVVADPAAPADPPACTAVGVLERRCTLVFPLPERPGTTRVLVLRRGDEQVRWDLVTT